jgi:hypothetical protein
MRYIIVVKIDEEQLREANSNKHEVDQRGTIEKMIEEELGWVQQSGIYARQIIEII